MAAYQPVVRVCGTPAQQALKINVKIKSPKSSPIIDVSYTLNVIPIISFLGKV
jgi:hypothetical protein